MTFSFILTRLLACYDGGVLVEWFGNSRSWACYLMDGRASCVYHSRPISSLSLSCGPICSRLVVHPASDI